MYFYIVLFKNILKKIVRYIIDYYNHSEEIHVCWNFENSSETCTKCNVENNVKKRKNNNILYLCLCI